MKYFKENQSLVRNNTFGIDIQARYYFSYSVPEELPEFLSDFQIDHSEIFVLGTGSNVLFTMNFDGLIIHPENKGIEIISENTDHVIVKAAAGEIWDDFVQWAVRNNYSGIENLSLIPGTVGACPVQNIGAYGVEICRFITEIEGYLLTQKEKLILKDSECMFDYRNSIFKHELRNQFIIQAVTFKLNKSHSFNRQYGNINEELNKFQEVNLLNMRQAIINIRTSKIPDPAELPNAGSFFKNPLVSAETAAYLQQKFGTMPVYQSEGNNFKLAAGWLIEKAGWKGRRLGNCGVHDRQSLVLVNYGNSTGSDILNLAGKIKESVFEKFGIYLEYEVNIL